MFFNINLSRTFMIEITFLLMSLVTSSISFNLQRTKRGTVTVGELPQIKPPTILKNGEQKYPSPGWTHCIKYLSADSRWRSIRSININKLQATQFQCSWFISTDAPGSQIRLSFEKVDFGTKPGITCTQQFLELIDIKAGKSQARMCGNKKYGDYVSVGQRVRIDVQGEEPLVDLLRTKQEPIVISYKTVKEPAGFRIGGAVKSTELKNKVKTSVGSVVGSTGGRSQWDRGRNIYGTKNQPGANNSSDNDESSDGRTSLTIWQVVIIIVITFAVVSCIVGVIVKRMVFDKKKKEEYLRFEDLNADNGSKAGIALPGGYTPQYSTTSYDKGQKMNGSDNAWIDKEIPRSSSKPVPPAKKGNHAKRHNSLGDVTTKGKTSRQKNKTEISKTISETKCTYTNVALKRPADQEKSNSLPGLPAVADDTPASRAPRRPKPIPKRTRSKKQHQTTNGVVNTRHKTIKNKTSGKKRHNTETKRSDYSRKRINKGNNVDKKEMAISGGKSLEKLAQGDTSLYRPEYLHAKELKSEEKSPKDDTPLSRAENFNKKGQKSLEKSTKDDTPLSRANKSEAKRPHSTKRSDVVANSKNYAESVSRDRHSRVNKKRDVLNNGTNKSKTVSTAHKKSTETNGKRNTTRKRRSTHGKKRPETNSARDRTERKSKRKREAKSNA